MKELAFMIAEKITNDNSQETIMICGSILKDEFLKMGFNSVNSNTMAVDTLKIIMKTIIRIGEKL
jgi:hypothetical protein